MLKLEPLIVCFYVSEGLPYSIKAVDYLVLETQWKLMVEIFIWTRCNILYPSESCESSAMAFDNRPPKGPCPLVGWDYKINVTKSPSSGCRFSSIQRDWGCPAALRSAALLHSHNSVPAELLCLSYALVACHRRAQLSFVWWDTILFSRPAVFRRRKKPRGWVMESSLIRQR